MEDDAMTPLKCGCGVEKRLEVIGAHDSHYNYITRDVWRCPVCKPLLFLPQALGSLVRSEPIEVGSRLTPNSVNNRNSVHDAVHG